MNTLQIYEEILNSGIKHGYIADECVECSDLLGAVYQVNLTYENMNEREKEIYKHACASYLRIAENIPQEIQEHIRLILSQP